MTFHDYYNGLDNTALSNSFDYIENFIGSHVSSWVSAPNTSEVESEFTGSLKNMSINELALLLIHNGYIPEIYKPDSSQETLYSKLIESLVCEWAIRVGFSQSFLQTQKSNKEDITIKKENKVIVCDAKSFRLGRSQAAPNVKDTIKKQAYSTWLEQHSESEKIGGLVTFPSLHDWKRGSEAYHYFTEGDPSVMMLFYEQMAYILLYEINADRIINFLNSYETIFPQANNSREYYWNGVRENLFSVSISSYNSFMNLCEQIIKKKVDHAILKLNSHLDITKGIIESNISQLSYEELKKRAVEAQYAHECSDIERQRDNIKRFRPNNLS